MKVDVTQADIDSARAALPFVGETLSYERCCPVAQSLRRCGFLVDVCTSSIKFVSVEGDDREVEMPGKAVKWIERWDNHQARERVKPFSFELKY